MPKHILINVDGTTTSSDDRTLDEAKAERKRDLHHDQDRLIGELIDEPINVAKRYADAVKLIDKATTNEEVDNVKL